MEKAIYKFSVDLRYGNLYGIFTANVSDINNLISNKTRVYFGEVCGKHSEIEGCIEEYEIELVSDEIEDVEFFENHNLSIGYNPLEYISHD